jgi:hypothetical protein
MPHYSSVRLALEINPKEKRICHEFCEKDHVDDFVFHCYVEVH